MRRRDMLLFMLLFHPYGWAFLGGGALGLIGLGIWYFS